MRWILALEELAQCILAIYAIQFTFIELPWWLWTILFFSPDLGMLGYLANVKVGAFTYNLVHHKALAIAIIAWGFFTGDDRILAAGLLIYAHSSFDRVFGYGLKYGDAFKHTHLGWIK